MQSVNMPPKRTTRPEEEQQERAKSAVKVFRGMLPGLNGYVRAITGNKTLRIELASGQPRTDGKKIYFEPPIALGDKTPHARMLCDRRDPDTYKQLCAACAIREDVLIKIYHEMAHNLYGTFKTDTMNRQNVLELLKEAEPKRAEQLRDKILSETTNWQSYQELTSHISEFLPVIINALEDARVDESMFQARKGTRVMFDAMVRDTFNSGIEGLDGNTRTWADMPLNSQVIVGIFTAACKYDYSEWFSQRVLDALNDPIIQELVADVDQLQDSKQTFERAFPILERLRELNFCLTEEEYDQKEEEQQDEPEQQDDSSEDEEEGTTGDPERGDQGEGEPDPEGSSESEESAGAGSDDEGSREGERDMEGDEGEPSDGDASEAPSDQSGDVRESDELDGEGSDRVGGTDEVPSDAGEDQSSDEGVSDDSEEASGAGDDRGSEESEGSGGSGADGDGEVPDSGDLQGDVQSGGSDDQLEPEQVPSEELTDGKESSDGGESNQRNLESQSPDLPYDDEPIGIPLREIFGDADQAQDAVEQVGEHGTHAESAQDSNEPVDERTIAQAIYFEKPSANVAGVRIHRWGSELDGPYERNAWSFRHASSDAGKRRLGLINLEDLGAGETVLGPALLHMRRVFADNERAQIEPHLKSGRVNARVLGKRAPFHDPRLFKKKRQPGKRSYAVLLGIDVSGSTVGPNIALAKQSAYAQAELCNRLGISFAIFAHSASNDHDLGKRSHTMEIYEIKSFDQPWDNHSQEALSCIGSWQENLDGHTIEYYRKEIENRTETDKIILYYSDGKMPAANHAEELEILQREILVCRQKRITLLGVGIRTDSPKQHGLDTVRVDAPADVAQVVKHLESALLRHR